MCLNIIGSGMKNKEEVLAYMKSSKWYDYFVKNLQNKILSYAQPLIALGYDDLDSYLHDLESNNRLRNLICDSFTWRYAQYPENICIGCNSKRAYWEKISLEYIYWYDT